MALEGKIEEVSTPEILQLISLTSKSGKLVFTDGKRQGVVIFHQGKIVFAASESLRETVGSAITSPNAHAAESGKKKNTWLGFSFKKTNPDNAASSPEEIEQLIRSQIESVVRELVMWQTGQFRFDIVDLPEVSDIALDARGLLLQGGVRPEEVLLSTLTKLDEAERVNWEKDVREASARESGERMPVRIESEISGVFRELILPSTGQSQPFATASRTMATLRQLVEELDRVQGVSSSLTPDVVLLLLRHAAQVVNRGVLFVLAHEAFHAVGQFGVAIATQNSKSKGRCLGIPANQPSILGAVAKTRRSYNGKLPPSPTNDAIVAMLGGGIPFDVIVIPLVLEGQTVAVYWGDNLPGQTLVGAVEGLEILIREVSLAMDKARLRLRLDEKDPRPSQTPA